MKKIKNYIVKFGKWYGNAFMKAYGENSMKYIRY